MTTGKRIGKYEIAEQIGVGGFGIVYKAWDPFIQRWVAVKSCNATDSEATQRFFREAQLAGALQHPNITLIFDFGMDGKTPYFVQEFLSGTDLDKVLETRTLTIEGVLAILLQVCAGLEFAHSRGIVHRDIKPANVRVLEDGTVKIMDFGIAKSLEAESRLTQTGVALGTAGYLAPEQLSGKPLDPRTDLFSLGAMAYEMVTGVRPFTGPNLSNVIYQILNQEPVALRQRNAACPERLERAILKALAKDPADRYANVREFAADLKDVLADLPRRGTSRQSETTTAMVREELARIARLPRASSPPRPSLRSSPSTASPPTRSTPICRDRGTAPRSPPPFASRRRAPVRGGSSPALAQPRVRRRTLARGAGPPPPCLRLRPRCRRRSPPPSRRRPRSTSISSSTPPRTSRSTARLSARCSRRESAWPSADTRSPRGSPAIARRPARSR